MSRCPVPFHVRLAIYCYPPQGILSELPGSSLTNRIQTIPSFLTVLFQINGDGTSAQSVNVLMPNGATPYCRLTVYLLQLGTHRAPVSLRGNGLDDGGYIRASGATARYH